MNDQEQPPLLVAYSDKTLSVEAAEQLVQIVADESIPKHAGADLPKANKAALLRKAAMLQKNR